MANYNFKKDSQVYLVSDDPDTNSGSYSNLLSDDVEHYFTFQNLSDGLVDKITDKAATVTGPLVAGNEVEVTTNTPYDKGLLFKDGSRGITLLSEADADAFEQDRSWAISLWFKADDLQSVSESHIIGRWPIDGWNLRLRKRSGQSTLDLILYGESNIQSPEVVNFDNVVTPDQWHHIVIAPSGGTPESNFFAYLDGVKLEKLFHPPRQFTLGSNAGPLTIGAPWDAMTQTMAGGFNFSGCITEVKLFNRSLSAPSASYLYNLGLSGESYKLEISQDFSFSQTFTDKSSPSKTLNRPDDYFEKSAIGKANPANFEFKIPVFKENDLQVVHDKLLSAEPFSLYVLSTQGVYKLEKCVITNGTYGIERSTPLTLTLSGEASKLSKLLGVSKAFTSPGIHQPMTSGRKYLRSDDISIELDGAEISSEVFSLSAELQNDVKWVENKTLYASIGVQLQNEVFPDNTAIPHATYPENFTVNKKVFSGSIGRYLCDTNSDRVNDFSMNSSLKIKVGERAGLTYGFEFDMLLASFTNRSSAEDIFIQNYDWRLVDNSRPLSSTIKYINI